MKYKIIATIGIIASILLFLVECVLVLHNAGCAVISHGSQYYERFHFNWAAVDSWDWIFLGIFALWFALLLIPWIQYFNAMRIEGRFRKTLVAKTSFLSVVFTIFNISLIVASILCFIKTGSPDPCGLYSEYDDELQDFMLVYVVLMSSFYLVSGLIVIVVNYQHKPKNPDIHL